eukprot:15436846-Alexandrium_andersonii.AAC.1
MDWRTWPAKAEHAARARPWEAQCDSPPDQVPSAVMSPNKNRQALISPYAIMLGSSGEAFREECEG